MPVPQTSPLGIIPETLDFILGSLPAILALQHWTLKDENRKGLCTPPTRENLCTLLSRPVVMFTGLAATLTGEKLLHLHWDGECRFTYRNSC